MISKYKLILFDAGGTLLHPYPSVGDVYSQVALRYGCKAEPSKLNDVFRQVWKKHDGLSDLDSHSDEKIERDWWQKIVFEVFESFGGVSDFEAFFLELYDLFAKPECWRLYPEVNDVLKTIQSQKKPMVIVSNWDSRLMKLCKEFEIESYFDFILASAVVGVSKPSPGIFEKALSHYEIHPSEVLHIGDSFADDVIGAQAAGVDVALLDRHQDYDLNPSSSKQPTYLINDLTSLIQ